MSEYPGIGVRPFPLPVERNNLVLTSVVPEVIRLSEPGNSSAPVDMTQQSKIAAALTKAGITNAAAWTAAGVPYGGGTVADSPRGSQVYVDGNDKDKDKGQP